MTEKERATILSTIERYSAPSDAPPLLKGHMERVAKKFQAMREAFSEELDDLAPEE